MSTPQPASGQRSAHKPKLAGAASRGYNVASAWQNTAALSEAQLTLLDQLGACCSVRAVPSHVVDDLRTATPAQDAEGSAEAYVGTLEDAVLHNTNQFHKWYSELETACASEMEEKYKRYADLLNSHLHTCEDILSKVDKTVDLFDALLTLHKEVSQRSKTLHGACEQLVREKDQLGEFADAIRTKLKFFDEFETVSAQFQKAQLSLDNDQYLELMKKLDDGLAYVASNPQYADAGTYTLKFRQLQGKALAAVRNKVQQVLKQAVQQVQAAIAESAGRPANAAAAASGAAPVLAEGSEVPLLYVRFRAAAEPSLKGLLREVESRSQRVEYQRLLQECQSLYCASRQQLVSPMLAQRLATQLSGQPLPKLTRLGCEQLLRVCQLEWQLFEQFFQPGAAVAAAAAAVKQTHGVPLRQQAQLQLQLQQQHSDALAALAEPLCMLLYDVLRPQIVLLQDINELCELVDVIKHEVLADHVAKKGGAAEALRPMLDRTLADVQTRIIYRCQAFIKDEVASYVPTPEDVDYPAKLDRPLPAATAATADGTAGGSSEGADTGVNNGAATEARPSDPYTLLYPPLRATLIVLSKLYRAVDSKTFGGLAQEAVSACTLSVQQASRGVARKSGPLDAQLFMIKHLLFLREQIAPFNVDFAVTDIDLDFTHMREHVRRIMVGESSIFALGANNAVVKMLGTGGPRVLTYQVDSKKELEKQLKGVCEAFIMAVTKIAVEPMLSFITKVTAVRVAAQAAQGQGGASRPASMPLREHAFAAPGKVAEVVGKVNDALAGPLPVAINKMRAYLPNPTTHAILFKPVKSNIAEAHGQVAALLSAEYTPEEVTTIPLRQPQELAALLDAVC